MKSKIRIFLIVLTAIMVQIVLHRKEEREMEISSEAYENIVPLSKNRDFLKKDGIYFFRDGDRSIETEYVEVKKISESYFQVTDRSGREFLIRENREVNLPEYDEILEISEERYILLKKDGESFYYDMKRERKIGESYERLGPFYDGRAYFMKDDKLGFIDTEGREIIENQFTAAGNFKGGYAIVADGRYKYITKDGELSSEEYDFIKIFENGEMLMKNREHSILQTERDRIRVQGEILYLDDGNYLFRNGGENRVYSSVAREFVKTIEGEYLGVMDGYILSKKDGKITVYDLKSRKSKTLTDKIKIVEIYREDQIVAREMEEVKAFLFNDKGEKISKGYDLIYPGSYEKIIVGDENGYGVIDKRGKTILDCRFDSIQLTPNHIITEQDGKKSLYSSEGKKSVPGDYRDIVYAKENIYVRDDEGLRYIYKRESL